MNIYRPNTDQEIDLKELFMAIWNKKMLILLITTLAAIFSVWYALSLPNTYTSKSLMAPSTKSDSLSSKLGAYSSLAGIAGIALPNETGGKTDEAIEIIKSYDFFENEFLPYIDFQNLVAQKRWKKDTNTIIYDGNIYDADWVKDPDTSEILRPSNQEAFEIYTEILNLAEDKSNGFVSISIEHVSPFIAQKWLNLIIININNHMKNLDKSIAVNSIDFLNKTSNNTNLAQVKEVISKLLQDQIQTLMLTEASKDYVFKIISSPIAPEKKSGPTRSYICILGTLLGFMISIIICLGFHFAYKKE